MVLSARREARLPHFADGYVATAAAVESELKRIGHTLQPLDIVVVNTSAGAKYGRPDYVASGCGMGAEATLYLLERVGNLLATSRNHGQISRRLSPGIAENRRIPCFFP